MSGHIQRAIVLAESMILRGREIVLLLSGITALVVMTLTVPVLGIVIACLVALRSVRNTKGGGVTHGSARWATLDDLMRAGCVFDPGGLLIGRFSRTGAKPVAFHRVIWAILFCPLRRSDEALALASANGSKPRPIPLYVPDTYPHTAIFGTTGSLKTWAFAIPTLMTCDENMFVLDSKGELARTTAGERARRFGHNIVILDPYGVSEGCGFPRDRFNPLDLYRGDERMIADEARGLASALVERTGKEHDKFWPESSVNVILGVLSFLMAAAKPADANLNSMRDILTSPKLMDEMLAFMADSDACFGLLRRMAGQMAQLEGQTKASVYSVANSHVAFLDSLPVAEMLGESTFDARQLIHGRQTVYLCLPVNRTNDLSGLQRVLLSTFLNLIFSAGEDRSRRIRFVLDEAATIGPLKALSHGVNVGRAFGLRMMFLFQATSQVELCFPESERQSFRSTVASVFCGVNDHASAKEVSEWIGSTTVHSFSTNTGTNTGQSTEAGAIEHGKSRNYGSSTSTSYNETARPLIQPEEVLQLPRAAAIALIPNVRPVLVEKVPWFRQQNKAVLRRLTNVVSGLVIIVALPLLMGIILWAVLESQAVLP